MQRRQFLTSAAIGSVACIAGLTIAPSALARHLARGGIITTVKGSAGPIGEAGPEAILPLGRFADGSLGVVTPLRLG
jgi:hypothetical protein